MGIIVEQCYRIVFPLPQALGILPSNHTYFCWMSACDWKDWKMTPGVSKIMCMVSLRLTLGAGTVIMCICSIDHLLCMVRNWIVRAPGSASWSSYSMVPSHVVPSDQFFLLSFFIVKDVTQSEVMFPSVIWAEILHTSYDTVIMKFLDLSSIMYLLNVS